MERGMNTIRCLRILLGGRGRDVTCIDGLTANLNDYVDLLVEHSTSVQNILEAVS